MVNINLKVEDELHKSAKIIAAKNGVTLIKWVNEAIRDKIEMDELDEVAQ